MFGLFSRRRKNELFRYWDGKSKRSADPVVLMRQLMTHQGWNADNDIPAMVEGDRAAWERGMSVMRDVFGVEAWTEQHPAGLTEREVFDLFWQFDDYLDGLKKSTSPSPTSQPATEPQPSETSTTKPSSGSGSISNEPRPDKPTDSLTPSPAP